MRNLVNSETSRVYGGIQASDGQVYVQSRTDAYGSTAMATANLSEILILAGPRVNWLNAISANGYGPSSYDSWFNSYEASFYTWDGYDSSESKPVELMGRNDETYFSEYATGYDAALELGYKHDQSLAPNSLAAIDKWSYDFQNQDNFDANDLANYTTHVPYGYSVLGALDNAVNGFYGVALLQESTGDIIFTFRGTDENVDWTQNSTLGNMGLVGNGIQGFTQDDSAVVLINQILPNAAAGTDVYFTGHSLGGALATFGAAYASTWIGHNGSLNIAAVTFGTAPASQLLQSWGLQNATSIAHTYNYVRDTDPIRAVHGVGVPGQMILYNGANNSGVIENHSISRYMSEVTGDVFALDISAGDAGLNDPIVIDLDGNGINFGTPSSDRVKIDFDRDGTNDQVAWAQSGDGVLIHDWDHDGVVSGLSEIVFGVKLGYSSDLEALESLDLNADGVFNSDDNRFDEFSIWKDINGDGYFDESELVSLEDAGILGISVNGAQSSLSGQGYQVTQTAHTINADGGTSAAWEVQFKTTDRHAA